jgi:hypothetical protein
VASSTTTEPYTYAFRITLLGVTPAVWRLVACPGSLTLETLHSIVQAAMGWKQAHPYEFEVGTRLYRQPGTEGKEALDARETHLEQLHLQQGATITYLYDRGDDWVHQIIVEGVAPTVSSIGLPLLLGGAGACPPEGSGGPGGYSELLQARKRRDTDEGRAAAARLGNDHEPSVWDPEEAARALATFGPKPAVTEAAIPVAAASAPAAPAHSGKKNKRRGR